MGQVLITGLAGGGVSSDDCTADKSKVLSGYTAVTSDSDGEAVAGTMVNVGAYDACKSIASGSGTLYLRMTNGAHIENTVSGYPELTVSQSEFGTATAAQVLSGCTFTSTAGLKMSGTMANRGEYQEACNYYEWTNSSGDPRLCVLFPSGAYTDTRDVNGTLCSETQFSAWKLGNAAAGQVRSGYSASSGNGFCFSGTLAVTSAISFSAAATSYNTIRISWTNPSKGPWQGVFIQISTSGYPGTGGGSRAYTGTGTNGSAASGSNYCDITGLTPGTTYYFTCTSYCDALGWGTSYNVMATTPTMSLKAILNSVGDMDPQRYYTQNSSYSSVTLSESTLSAGYATWKRQDSSIVPDSNTIAILLITLNENAGNTILSLCQHWVGKTLITNDSATSVTRTITGVTLYRNALSKYQYLQIKTSSSVGTTSYKEIIFPS